tara:strand:- start:217 stop:495 length:279 start_codon:yes stop_codon:yes gene_type:complete
MKNFNKFIEEAAAKRCPEGKYWCYDDQKCKKIPGGYHVGRGGYLAPDNRSDAGNGNGNGNGNGGNGNGGNGGGNGGSGGNGGGGNGGGGNGG